MIQGDSQQSDATGGVDKQHSHGNPEQTQTVNAIQSVISLLTDDQKEIVKKQIEERDIILQKRKDDLDTRIQCATDEIETYQLVDLTKLESNLKKLELAIYDIDSKIGECHMSITTNEHFIGGIKDKLNKMSDIKSGVKCEKCLQDIDHSHTELIEAEKESSNVLLKHYEDGLVELHEELVKNRETKNKLVSKQTQIQRSLEEAKTDILKKQNLEKNLEQLLESKKDLDDDMNVSNLSIASFDANIDSTSERLDEESKNLSELQQKLSDYDICKFILGEEGVKSFVVKKLLDLLNNTIEKYLIDLGISLRTSFLLFPYLCCLALLAVFQKAMAQVFQLPRSMQDRIYQ
jgi:chromosome segregation ATPase